MLFIEILDDTLCLTHMQVSGWKVLGLVIEYCGIQGGDPEDPWSEKRNWREFEVLIEGKLEYSRQKRSAWEFDWGAIGRDGDIMCGCQWRSHARWGIW